MSASRYEDGGRLPEAPALTAARLAMPPGNPMMWILIGCEVLVFGLGLLYFAVLRNLDPAGFLAGQSELDRLAGTINTAVLLTSGLFAALAVAAREHGRRTRARALLTLAGLLGLVFLGIKADEYAIEIGNGHGLSEPGFFMLYFLITGFHALHVVFGLVVLAIAGIWDDLETIETATSFWHMVDLIWVMIFPCLYLMR